MKNNGNRMLLKYAFAGFCSGIISTIPWLLIFTGYFTHERLSNALFSKYAFILACFIPIIFSAIGYAIARVRLSRFKLSDLLRFVEDESKELKQELLEYKYALDLSAIITIIDSQGKIKMVNDNFLSLTGFEKNELIGRSIWRFPSTLQQPGMFDSIRIATKDRNVWNGEIAYYGPNNNTTYTRATVVPLQQKATQHSDCLIIQYDITGQKQIDLALQKSEKEKSIILSNTRTLICTHDTDGVITDINRAGADMLGAAPNDIIGANLKTFIDPRFSAEDYMEALRRDGCSSGYMKVITSLNEKRTLVYNNVTCVDQGLTYIIGSALDITETLEAQKTIDNQRSFINQIVDESPNLICVIDEEKNLSFINRQFKNFFGVNEETAGMPLHEALTNYPEFEILSGIKEEQINNDRFSVHECKVTDQKTNETKWFKVQKSSFSDNSHKNFVLIIAMDITMKIDTQNELIKARQAVETSLKLKENFIANMSHEIRTPLNAIIGFSELLFDTDLTEQQSDYLKTVKVAGQNLLGVINDILDLSRLESGMIQVAKNKADIRKAVVNVKKMFEPKVMEKQIGLSVDFEDQIPAIVLADELRLNQILINLVGNAIKFTNKGKVEIMVRLASKASATSCQLEFIVKDSGIGIEKEKLDVIFQRYSQASGDIHKLYGGTGLGLSISKSLIELLGGSIKLSSEIGLGTTFSFTLPFEMVPTDIESLLSNIVKPVENNQPLRILLAEDNATNARLAMHILSKHHHQVDHVKDGTEVLDILVNKSYDIILMDVQMTHMDGLETCKAIRNSGASYSKMPIIALTAHSFKGEKEICGFAGMDGYVSKPYRPAELLNCISTTIQNHQLKTTLTAIQN